MAVRIRATRFWRGFGLSQSSGEITSITATRMINQAMQFSL